MVHKIINQIIQGAFASFMKAWCVSLSSLKTGQLPSWFLRYIIDVVRINL